MIVCADDDILTPRYFSEDFAARIPNAKTHFAKRGGHALSRTEPEIFNQIAIDFFRGAYA
jgi:aminoacrylate hydrolase